MAMVKCKECGGQVSSSAKACPTCGAAPPKRTSAFTWIVSAFLIFIVARVAVDSGSNGTTSAQKPRSAPIRAASTTPLPPPPPAKPVDPQYAKEFARINGLSAEDFCIKELRKLRRTKGTPRQPWFDALAKVAQGYDVRGDHLVNIQAGHIIIGMPRCAAMAAWGTPERVNKTTNSYGTSEQWVYGSGNYLYFKGEVLTSFQN